MFDEFCNEMRDVIYNALEDAFMSEGSNLDSLVVDAGCECISVEFIDDGLAIRIGDALYGISILKV